MATEHVNDDRYWMDMAIAEAKLAGPDIPVGSVLVSENRVLVKGHNQKERSQDPTDHAEIVVIRLATSMLKTWRLSGTTLYTTLEPCPMCAEAIIQSRVSRLVFGAYDPRSGAVCSVFNLFVKGRPYPIPEVLGGIAENECKALLIEFFRGKND